jgi:hypothetical protein
MLSTGLLTQFLGWVDSHPAAPGHLSRANVGLWIHLLLAIYSPHHPELKFHKGKDPRNEPAKHLILT